MPHPYPNSVDLVEVPYKGHGFMVAAGSIDHQIIDIKIGHDWWPIHEVASANLIAELQRTLLAMPSNSEGGDA